MFSHLGHAVIGPLGDSYKCTLGYVGERYLLLLMTTPVWNMWLIFWNKTTLLRKCLIGAECKLCCFTDERYSIYVIVSFYSELILSFHDRNLSPTEDK